MSPSEVYVRSVHKADEMKQDSKFTVHQRLSSAEARITTLEQQLKAAHTELLTTLRNEIADTAGKEGKPGRDGASIVGPAGPAGKDSTVPGPEGRPGRDGRSIIGPQGIRGLTGATPEISIGEVQTIAADQPARIWMTGTFEKPVLNFAIPRGAIGATGERGESIVGPRGDVLIPNESELHSAVIALRKQVLKERAVRAAIINQAIADNEKQGIVGKHFARLLADIQRQIGELQ